MNSMISLLILVGILIYAVFPYDLIPDFFPGWGWIDDLVVIYMSWRYYRRQSASQGSGKTSGPAGNRTGTGRNRTSGPGGGQTAEDPHMILGIAPDASREEIKSAYRRLASKYHPDKVQHLGEEFQKLAEERFKKIQQAYNELISR